MTVYVMECPECDNYGETADRATAAELVDMHNDRRHDGDEVADWEADR